ncbi:MAG: S-methyl-5-thioribose-1-phosphate isomerase [Candidatus Sumerlaeota bacterium]|nr:S-methyl-5-thioribose-1-phosphate isomerase [Candidatus Sumerlaeota bacterium]
MNSELGTRNSELASQNSELGTRNSELASQNSDLGTRNSELVTLAWDDGAVRLLDQTLLPGQKKYLRIETPQQMWDAIKRLCVRGAPAIGDAAAFGAYLGVKDSLAEDFENFYSELEKVASYLKTSRPTAVNLFWALDRMTRTARENASLPVAALKVRILQEAQAILNEDLETCHAIGRHAATLIGDGATVLTHCNAGGLATAGYGTALAGIYAAREQGRQVSVIADETRPLLQGARITCFELKEFGVPVTLICDNMAATVMRQGKVNLVIVGADRIAANGDTANKIGTYGLSILAREHGVPFYVAAPLSTIDLSLSDGARIPIEERDAKEVTSWGGIAIAPDGINVFNPAFDMTPAANIAAIITEKGIARPPFLRSLAALFKENS